MTPRVNYMEQSPVLVKKYTDFTLASEKARIEHAIVELVCIRASQINGCAFCVDMHVKRAKIAGERELRIHHLPVWRESSLFVPRERAALAWTEALTHLDRDGVPEDIYNRVRTQYSEKELADLTFVIMSINGWNRVNAAFTPVPGSCDEAWGLDKAGLQ